MTDAEATLITEKVLALYPDEEAAREYLERRRWPNGAVCPECECQERITLRTRVGFFRCNACEFDFTVRTGTIFERSHVPLQKWVAAMYLLVSAKEGISAIQLAQQIGVTRKSAWFILHRLREACGSDENIEKLRGKVEYGVAPALQRGVHPVYRQCSQKHLSRYVDEFAFRHVIRPVLERLDYLIRLGVGKRITYKDLTA